MLGSGAEFEQVNKTSHAASAALEEVTIQDLDGGGAILDVDSQALTEEDFELAAELVGALECRGAVGGDQEKSFQRLFIEIRRLGLNHLDSHDTERPHVNFAAIFLLLDDFGGHPVGRPDHGGALVALFGQFGAEAEVGDFDGAAGGEKDVVGFDVAVDDVLAVQVHEAFACLFALSVSGVLVSI